MAKFIGDAGAVHIHAEGRSYHYKNSLQGNGSRRNFSTNHQNQIDAAYQDFLNEGWSEVSGYQACKKYFEKNLGAS